MECSLVHRLAVDGRELKSTSLLNAVSNGTSSYPIRPRRGHQWPLVPGNTKAKYNRPQHMHRESPEDE